MVMESLNRSMSFDYTESKHSTDLVVEEHMEAPVILLEQLSKHLGRLGRYPSVRGRRISTRECRRKRRRREEPIKQLVVKLGSGHGGRI